MKLLCVVPSYWPAFQFGGPIYSVHSLNKALVKKGVDVTVYTTNMNGSENLNVPINKEVIIDGVKVYYFKSKKPKSYAFLPSLWKALSITAKDFDLFHIHCLYSFPTLISTYYARKYKIPYIIAPRGMMIKEMIKKKSRLKKVAYISLFEKRNIEKASGVHCTVENEKQDIEKFGFNIKNYFVVPNGIDLKEFHILPPKGLLFEEFLHLKDKKIILFFSRINWKKGLDILIRAYSMIAKERNDVHLLIVGPDNERYGEKVKGWIKSLGLGYSVLGPRPYTRNTQHPIPNTQTRVTFTGMLTGKDKLMVLQGSDIFVLPSYSENFGMAVVEAMACGLPVVISNKVGIYKEVEKNKAGIVVDADAESLYKGIKSVLDNENLAKELSINGKRLVEEYYDINKVADRMIDVYEEMLK